MNSTTRWIALAIVLLAATSLGAAQQDFRRRQPGPGGAMPAGPPPLGHLEQVLDLTDAQKASLEALHEEQRQEAEPILAELRGLHESIRRALESETPDATTIGQAMIVAHAAEQRLRQLHRAGRERLASQLTDEQRARLEAVEKEHGPLAGGRGMRPRMHGHGPGDPMGGPPPDR